MPPRKLLVFLAFLVVPFSTFSYPCLASADGVSFDFLSFTLRNFTLLGDSYLRNGVIGLTRDLGVPSSSAGTIIYNEPITFFDSESNITASFSTSFSFSIPNLNPASFGDGLAFFLSPDNQTLGSPGGYLGLVNSSQLTKNKFVAIEFDTRLDPHFSDPSENHVGLDIESLNSIKAVDALLQGIDLKSGNSITAWIDYVNDKRNLTVSLSYSSFKPEQPVLSVDIDLSDYLKDVMYVGFSASTEGSTELHLIENWSFSTFGFVPARPRSRPHNVSDSSVPVKPAIPVSSPSNKHHNRLGFGFGIAGPAFFFVVLAVFGYVSLRKWRGIRTQMSFKAELLAGPREFTYGELKSATRGFHSSRIIGHGAFGTVYKAFFVSSKMATIAAVKRSKHSHEGKTEFLAELSIIAGLRHKNLVQLQGWCVAKGELLLVYDFMPNGSLDKVLYPESGSNYPGSFLMHLCGGDRIFFLIATNRSKECQAYGLRLTFQNQEKCHREGVTGWPGSAPLDIGLFVAQVFGVSLEHHCAWKELASSLLNAAWSPPLPGVLKINCDVAICSSFAAAACVGRDCSGCIVFATSELLPAVDPLEGECLAVALAVRKAGSLNLQDFVIEGDCRVLFDVLDSAAPPQWKIDPLIHNIRHADLRFRSCRWQCVPCCANSLSHRIAQWAASSRVEGDIPFFLSTLVLILGFMRDLTPRYVFQVGGEPGWIQPTGNETETYNDWATKYRFHVGDALYFKYQNDSVLAVNFTDYSDCIVSNPISQFEDGNTVLEIDRVGFFYFISGKPDHCKAGQKLVIRVMVQSDVQHSPRTAASPRGKGDSDDDDGWDSFNWGPPSLNSTINQSAVSFFLTVLGGILVIFCLCT
ncbi:putative L-type lectin-domain containing receptor kinase S.7 [Morella rubra]|uniref:Putative L-type lectin-domain containing receptor kinase S.7 n=1 Tax=Morella rubra TaxID=262757 RepID=A0A6A1VQC7_9ROSI|nr:putative L-type lectin-domain containing receptor kinase S.7 [Morella rubra]